MTTKTKKIVLGVFAGLIALFAILAVIAPRDFYVERSVVIDQPRPVVFAYVKLLKKGEEWGPWSKLGPDMKLEYKGARDGTVGAIVAWSGNKDVGVGEQEIIAIKQNERIDYELRFKEPMEGTDKSSISTQTVEGGKTKVTWIMESKLPFPMHVFCFLMNGTGMVAEQFDIGLAALKERLEREPRY